MREPWAPATYEATEQWIDRGLRDDDSLFTPGTVVWSAENLEDLLRRVVENPDLGKDSFAVKLEKQLATAAPEVIQLAAEILYVHFLIIDDIRGPVKRDLVARVLAWSPSTVTVPVELDRAFDGGVATGGVAFKTHRPKQVAFLIRFALAWKALDVDARDELLRDAWRFKEFVYALPVESAQSQRSALLHLVHPEAFESITSDDVKRRIALGFPEFGGEEADIDRRLSQIRAGLSVRLGHPVGWWDDAEVRERWYPTAALKIAKEEDDAPPSEGIAELAEELLLGVDYLRRIERLLVKKRQIVFYGPPGTGKTYVAQRLAEVLVGEHRGANGADSPKPSASARFESVEAAQEEMARHRPGWLEYQRFRDGGDLVRQEEHRTAYTAYSRAYRFYLLHRAKGARSSSERGPGGHVRLVQFHPSYAYEDFIEGYRPDPESKGSTFSLQAGPLRRIVDEAEAEPESTFVLIIDELNRANIAKVFGELYFLLEYRGEEIDLQYSRQPFSLPENLWFIATMNTADRSIALIDAALRRRFFFVPFFPDEAPVEGLLSRWLDKHKPSLAWVARVVDAANAKLDDRHLAIGPSHFMRDDLDEEWVSLIWEHSVLPTIADRFFGEDERLREFDLDVLRSGKTQGVDPLVEEGDDETPDPR